MRPVIRAGAVTLTATFVLLLGLSCSTDGSKVSHASASAKRPYVVLLVMDEFPGDSLLDRHRRIDPVRYPNFAALAADATWFRNAFSVYDSTTKAVPLILDGIKPHKGTAADSSDHPHTIYDMFARHGYRVVDSEEATALCPPSICHGARTSRPAIIPNLLGGRPQRFNRWVQHDQAGPPDALGQAPAAAARPLPLPARRQADATKPGDLLPGMNTVPGFARRVRHPPQRAALPAPARLRRPAARSPDPPAQAGGHLRRHPDRGHRRPRDRVPVRRADAPQRQPVERRGADADPAVRKKPGQRAGASATSSRARST